MSRGGFRSGAGAKRSKHGLIAEAAGIMQAQAMKLYAVAVRDGKIPTRALAEISRGILRETMAARRRIQAALRMPAKPAPGRRKRPSPVV